MEVIDMSEHNECVLTERCEKMPNGCLQIRRVIKDENGNDIYHRHVIHPFDDISNEPEEIIIEAEAHWKKLKLKKAK